MDKIRKSVIIGRLSVIVYCGLSMAFMWLFLALMITLVWRDIARSRRMHRVASEQEKEFNAWLSEREAARNFRPAFDLGTPAKTNAVPAAGGKSE